jgi:hypothetical protein
MLHLPLSVSWPAAASRSMLLRLPIGPAHSHNFPSGHVRKRYLHWAVYS